MCATDYTSLNDGCPSNFKVAYTEAFSYISVRTLLFSHFCAPWWQKLTICPLAVVFLYHHKTSSLPKGQMHSSGAFKYGLINIQSEFHLYESNISRRLPLFERETMMSAFLMRSQFGKKSHAHPKITCPVGEAAKPILCAQTRFFERTHHDGAEPN